MMTHTRILPMKCKEGNQRAQITITIDVGLTGSEESEKCNHEHFFELVAQTLAKGATGAVQQCRRPTITDCRFETTINRKVKL